LGLSICRELAELMGGAVEATSRQGEGSTFTVTLPALRVGDARGAAALPAAAAALEPGAGRPLRVLAAEDNETNRLVLTTLLAHAGVETVTVANGALAVDAWAAEDWDVILMDVQMPVMDGPTAVRRIRVAEVAAGRPRTPIIALTANAMAHQIAEYL